MWRPIDAIADWLRHGLGARAQLRLGILAVIIGAIWTTLVLLFGNEPPNVIGMSGVALILGGITMVISAEVLEQGESDGEGGG